MRKIEVGSLARHAPTIDGLRHADRQARRHGRQMQGDLVMTAIQAHYVQYLVWASRGLAMSTLAQHTRTSAANVTQVVQRMERHGLVQRRPSDMDGRSIVVRVTARGAHQYWQLVRSFRKIEAQYRANANAKPIRDLPTALRRVGPPLAIFSPDPPLRLPRHRRGFT